jgi:hypothetical protein
VSVPTADELAEAHRDAVRRIHSLSSAHDYADSALIKITEGDPHNVVLRGLALLLLDAVDLAKIDAVAAEEVARDRARDAWVAEQVAADVAATNKAAREGDVTQATS